MEKKRLPTFNLLISIAYMIQVIGIRPTVWMFCQPLAMFVIHLSGSSFLVWITALLFLFVDDEISGPVYYLGKMLLKDCTPSEGYVFSVTWHWVSARCTSYCLDSLWKENDFRSRSSEFHS